MKWKFLIEIVQIFKTKNVIVSKNDFPVFIHHTFLQVYFGTPVWKYIYIFLLNMRSPKLVWDG